MCKKTGCKEDLTVLNIKYSGQPLTCISIEEGNNLQTTFEKINDVICSLKNNINNSLTIKSIGSGLALYGGKNEQDEHQIKTIKQGPGIQISSTENAITISKTNLETRLSYDISTNTLSSTYTDGTTKSTIIDFSETLTTLNFDEITKVLTYVGEDGLAKTINLSAVFSETLTTLEEVAGDIVYTDEIGNETLVTLPKSTSDLTNDGEDGLNPFVISGSNVSLFVNDSGYLTSYTETDPVFEASPASSITSQDITNWNSSSSVPADQTIIDGSTNSVAGGPVFNALEDKLNIGFTDVGNTLVDIRSSFGFKFQETGSFTGLIIAGNSFSLTAGEDDNSEITSLFLDSVSLASTVTNQQIIDKGETSLVTLGLADARYAAIGSGGTVDFDDVPTDGSIKAVRSNGVFDALAAKVNSTGSKTITGQTIFTDSASFNSGVFVQSGGAFVSQGAFSLQGISTETYLDIQNGLIVRDENLVNKYTFQNDGSATISTDVLTKGEADSTYALIGSGGSGTVDQTIIDGSSSAVSGNAVFDGLALKPNLAGTNNFTGTAYWTGNVFANVLSSRYHQVTNTPLPTNTDNGSSSSGVLRAGDQNGEMVWLGHTAAMIFDNSLITSARTYTMPNKSGTVAMTSDIVENTSGTWTPVVTTTGSASYTYNTSVTGGIWTKVGKTVTFKCTVVINSKSGTPTGSALQITGFPFASKTIGGYSAVNPVPIHHTKFLDVAGTVTGALSGSTFLFFQPDLSNAGEILPVNYSALRGSASGALTLYGTIIVD
ncbi:structural protein [Cellulophaga phage phi4:1]|uniref:Structural protein n=3 Tax=Lightbulbvirus Cba41 TaxID=1918524 RepID=A0A0S2MWH7_9CAUD|nr:virion structural protein [Cellulophaga phage phi4:1]AGO49460.1 structural protein [Cellulophaga phage phi4:1]ALO80056.1 structural protein [Cellulophaga phage phi4:1_13]ALO80253.1 structural protein [Cellulophaga phage phi4:1_18]